MINKRLGHYILKEDHTIEEVDMMTWARQFENAHRVVKQDHINGWFISTVFIGYDNEMFETMIFDQSREKTWMFGKKKHKSNPDVYQERYQTYDEALDAHNKVVETLTNGGAIEGMYNYDNAS